MKNVATLLILAVGISVSNVALAQSQISCPLKQVSAIVSTTLPTPWWYTPTEGGLISVQISKMGEKSVLVCEYSAFGGTVSVMRDVPAGATSCSARNGGFECVSARPQMSVMGPLTDGIAYLQSDLYSKRTKSAESCAAVCANDQQCKAMTFVKSQHLCWIKNAVPATAPSTDMTSAVKLDH